MIHNLSLWTAADKTATYEQVKSDAQHAKKDMKIVSMSAYLCECMCLSVCHVCLGVSLSVCQPRHALFQNIASKQNTKI